MTVNQHTSIIVADDHPLLLKGLIEYLEEHKYNVLDSAKNGEEAAALILQHQPDIALLDIEMPIMNGIEVAQQIEEKSPNTKVILLSYHDNPEYVISAKKANIKGFILKEDALKEIKESIRIVLNGDRFFSKKLQNIDTSKVINEVDLIKSLTRSQRKIINMIADGKNTKQIAEELHLSVRTIEKHRSNICSKLGLSGNAYQLNDWVHRSKKYLNLDQ